MNGIRFPLLPFRNRNRRPGATVPASTWKRLATDERIGQTAGARANRRSRSGSRAVPRDWSAQGRARERQTVLVIVVAYLLLAGAFSSVTLAVMRSRTSTIPLSGRLLPPVRPARYLVLMVLDGARPDYFNVTPLPHLDALRARGTQFSSAMDGILEAETPSGHATLSTGSSPARTGILGFDWAQNSADYSLFSPDVVRSGAMEHIMQAAGVPTIAQLYKARFPRAQVVALSGHKYYAADPLGGPNADAIMYYQGSAQGTYVPVAIPGHTPPPGVMNAPGLIGPNTQLGYGGEDNLATKLALSAFHVMRQRLTLINYPEFDWPLGHVDGGSADRGKLTTLMKAFDRDLGLIEAAYRRAGVLNQTLFVITADHGMSPVSRYIPDSVVKDAVAKAGTTAPAISSTTGSYIWLLDGTKSALVAHNILAAGDPGIESVYYRAVEGGRSVYRQAGGQLINGNVLTAHLALLDTLLNGHEPNVVAFARVGQSFALPTTHWKADHGGPGWQSQHIPLLLAGPGIRPGVTTDSAAKLADVAPTLLTAMGVRPTGMEGSVLTDALVAPRPRDTRRRTAEKRMLTPLVKALIEQDNYESGQ